MTQELTNGSPGKVIFYFTVPIFIGNILQQIYQIVDTMIVGQFVGAEALAAVGATYGIYFLVTGLIWGITAGFTVPTAQRYGKGDRKNALLTIGTAVILSAAIMLIFTPLSVLAMPWLLRMMHTPEDIYEDAYSYIVVICAGMSAQLLYNLLASILRAVGNSKVPLFFLVLSSLMNIFLDLVLICCFHMGVMGAALATVISQGISGLLCLWYIWRKVPFLTMKQKLSSSQKSANYP